MMNQHIASFITMWIQHILTTTLTMTTNFYLSVVTKHRKLVSQLLLLHLIKTNSDDSLLNIGAVLSMSNRTLWMKTRSNDWWANIVMKHFLDEDWLENFRMSKETFLWLCNQLEAKLKPNENCLGTRDPVSVEKQVAITLYFLASCAEYRVVGNAFGVHKSTVCKCVHKVVNAIVDELLVSCLNMPDAVECENISYHFEQKSHIPQLIGAIDGTHIPLLPPSDGYRDFVNRKGWPSIILQAVVDHAYRFRNINCQAPGSCHDASVFRRSQIYTDSNRLIPNKMKSVNAVDVPFLIMGDPAYPLLSWLIKGYTKTARLSPEEESFNVHLSCVRVCVEIAFGRLKARWRCLLKRLDLHYTFVPNVVTACCILHNIVESRSEKFLSSWTNDVKEAEIMFPQPDDQRDRTRDHYNGNMIRDTLTRYLAENFPLRRTFI